MDYPSTIFVPVNQKVVDLCSSISSSRALFGGYTESFSVSANSVDRKNKLAELKTVIELSLEIVHKMCERCRKPKCMAGGRRSSCILGRINIDSWGL